jgi:hypothetical protein
MILHQKIISQVKRTHNTSIKICLRRGRESILMRKSTSVLSANVKTSGLTTSNDTSTILMRTYSKPGQTSKLKTGSGTALKRLHQDLNMVKYQRVKFILPSQVNSQLLRRELILVLQLKNLPQLNSN